MESKQPEDPGNLPNEQDQQPARIPYPQDWVEQVRLPDGLELSIRPIRPDDAQRLQSGFKRLSSQSVYLRFLGALRQLSDEQARSLSEVDYCLQMAFIASLPVEGEEFLVGVARYAILQPEEPGLAEAAVVVGDEYQKRGIGTLLLDRLIRYAAGQGVTEILATVHATNQPMLQFIQKTGLTVERKMLEPGVWEIRVKLKDEE